MLSDEQRIASFARKYLQIPGGNLVSVPLAGDVSSRRYYRVLRSDGSGSPALVLALYPAPFVHPRTGAEALALRLALDPDGALSWANDPNAQLETTSLLLSLRIPVSPVIAADGECGIVATWDLGDLQLQQAVAGADLARWRRWYTEATDLVVALQKATPAALAAQGVAARLALDGPKLSWEMAFFDRAFWDDHRPGMLGGTERAAALRELRALCHWIGERPRVLCHRDFHARNLMVYDGPLGPGAPSPTDERLVIIDHQDARLGPGTYDLVSLLEDPYVHPPAAIHPHLWQRWEEAMGHRPGSYEEERLAVTAQRLIKAAGTYAHQVAVRGVTSFEAHLRPSLARAHEALSELGRYPAACTALEIACRL